MTTMKISIHHNANGLDYTLVNDHYLPNLTATAPAEQHPTGRWGRLHKRYLEEHHPVRYNQLVLSGKLGSYLATMDKQANEQLARIIRQMQERAAADENLVYWGVTEHESQIGGFVSVDENTDFYINADGNPVVCFAEYEAAPGFMGIQEFEIKKQ